MPFLEHDGVTRELPPGDTLVGSGSEADWRLQTINLAPRHFVVSVGPAGQATLSSVRAQDLDVNGEPLSAPRTLAHGDEIIAGAGVFAYLQSLQPAAPAAPATRAYLIDIAGLAAFPLAATPVRIGRDPTSEIVVRDAMVARFHAEVRPADPAAGDGPAYTIRALAAAGSTVNGSLIGGAPRPLAEGDLIRLGTTTLRFTTAAPPAAARVVVRSEPPTAAGARTRMPPLPQRASEPTSSPPPPPSPTLADTLRAAAARPRNVVIALVVVVLLAAMALLRGGGHSP